jgi:MSHA pilin protein MshA
MRNAARGFTLVELVVVITILGILSAFAVPKFLALDGQARIAAVQGLQGSVRSASSLAHSLFLANGGNPVVMEGVTITMTNQYPALVDIDKTLQDMAGFSYTVSGTTGTFAKTGAPTAATCSFTYQAAASAGAAPAISVVNTVGC